MVAIKYPDALITFRATVRELNKVIKSSKERRNEPTVKHMLNLFRENQVTEKRYCRPQDHYKYFADTYLTYLRSLRLQDEITKKYFHKEERTIERSARLVGLELPKQYNKG